MIKLKRYFPVLAALLLVSASNTAAQDIERTFSTKAGETLRLDIETGGDIVITGWNRDEVSITIGIRGRDAEDVLVDMDDSGNGVFVGTEFDRRRSRADLDIEIRVPSRYDLDIETSGGEVRIEGVEGSIEGQTMGGDLDFRNLKGTIDFSTMGGSISVRNSVLDGEVETMGGEVLLDDVTGSVNGSTMGGEVTYRNVRSGAGSKKEVEISTMGGEINLDSADHGATLHTMGGEIRVRSARDHVKATTMGGEILIDDIDGWVEATTMGGDIEVHMTGDADKGDRHVELSSMGGDIILTVPDGLSMDIEIEITVSDGEDADDYRIVSDFELDVERSADDGSRRRRNRRQRITANTTVDGGKNRIRIETVNGDVFLRKAR